MKQYCAIIKCVQNFSPKKGKVYFMKVKQWLASSLAVPMLVSTVGCGDNSSSSKAESKSNNSSAVVSETAMPEKDYATTTAQRKSRSTEQNSWWATRNFGSME